VIEIIDAFTTTWYSKIINICLKNIYIYIYIEIMSQIKRHGKNGYIRKKIARKIK